MFRIAICDDDPEDMRRYKKIILTEARQLVPEVAILTYPSQESLLFALEEMKDLVDTLFLDIRMPGLEGPRLVKRLRDCGYGNDIVFLTSSEEDMLLAFDVGALNYLVKGKTTRERTKRVLRQAVQSALKKQSAKLVLRSGGETRTIPLVEVSYFAVKDHLIVAYYGEESFAFISSMGKLENRLSRQGFVRIHRAYLVSCRYIESFTKKEVVLTTGKKLPITRKHYPELRKTFPDIGTI